MRPLVPAVTGLVALTTILAGSLTSPAQSSQHPRSGARGAHHAAQARTSATTVPTLKVTRIIRGLNLPWDAKQLPGGRLLVTERESKHLLTWYHGRLRRVAFPAATVWASGETGLMSLAIAPGFGSSRRFYTCQGGNAAGGGHEVKVLMWHLNAGATRATLEHRLLGGLPSTSGRHAGCRLLIARYGALIVGTGDAAHGTNPQDLSSLGGKTLRLDRFSGAPWPNNAFINSSTPNERFVFTYGHRNVQGLAQRADGTIWSVEHGPDRDDEVNRIQTGANYGWNPVPNPYNENVPMTDHSISGAVDAKWSSGSPTLATSGAAWVSGKQWGAYDGTLAVAALKGSRVQFMRFSSTGAFVSMRTPPVLRQYGRLRSVSRLANGDLMVTTSNGDGHDSVLRVHPGS
jgi:glucose/arabinose dehydrogenase